MITQRELSRIATENTPDRLRCTYKMGRERRDCKNYALPGNDRCGIHESKGARGLNGANFQSGRYSSVLPDRLVEKYETARNDPNLLMLRDEIAVMSARIASLLETMDDEDSQVRWLALNNVLADLRIAHNAMRRDDEDKLLEKLVFIVENGVKEIETWDSIGRSIEMSRKLIETEQKRLVNLHQVITVERLMVMLSVITESIQKNVKDPEARAAIGHELARLVSVGTGGKNQSAGASDGDAIEGVCENVS